MNILFINYHNFASNSAIHIFNLANRLVARGHSCVVAVPDRLDTVLTLGRPDFKAVSYADVQSGRVPFEDGGPPALVYAWTPREGVRQLTEAAVRRWRCPYCVHLEDNEELIAAEQLGSSWPALMAMTTADLDAAVGLGLSHPHRYRGFLAKAAGISVIIDRLLEFVPPDVPSQVIWPSFDTDLFKPMDPDPALRTHIGLSDADRVIVYPGNVHAANLAEVRSLYLAVGILNRSGFPVKLVRVGEDSADPLGQDLQELRKYIIAVGRKPHLEIPRYLALSDVLVQPGRSDPFNDYRFPSKLPEFFAMGRPVVLPSTNIGRSVIDFEEAITLKEGSARELSEAVARILSDKDLAERLRRGALAFADRALSWDRSTDMLMQFIKRVTSRLTQVRNETAVAAAAQRYTTFAVPPISYATVRDFCDSFDHLPVLACANKDMKDVQRAWMFKAILGTVKPGGTLLEIGGGTPLVADLLVQLGFKVWVMDPYDGRDNGPTTLARIRADYPRVNIVPGLFPDALTQDMPDKFDGIYSISVMEHLPAAVIEPVFEAMDRHLAPEGASIHAVDHVHLGAGDADHLARLTRMVRAMGLDEAELQAQLARVDSDVEAYFLSAEAHNGWRGTVDYDSFPMRRCISVHLFKRMPTG